ncbi:hypothetical protein EDF31_102262 [Curtobacterium sp. PhB142]|uniref:UPF0182 family membrane protein n=1 Tax=unclassified Curtobacterium TaxID=257496 RepID=UPI0010E5F7C7|nr:MULTISPECIES: UPF0182 family protein [unclassified Curtobacterium]TCL78045.1 hypothetical protein EDF23_10595 [Curtobacterium sp. PhB128]TCL87562.1 hypothetical protein EDF31_102262 [Curtobacterium sp. PhB142]TCL94770.1 hypothetical protein EDF29_10595 [Curtobacterium sp. PhB138]TCM05089.1 hypothetical protein EDF26_101317 [Curtobacterium sp. PhB134]
MTTTSSTSGRRSPRVPIVVTIIVLAALVIGFFIFASLYTDYAWFAQLGFQQVLTTRWIAGTLMFLAGFLGMAIPVFLSIGLAFRYRPVYAKLNSQLDRYQQVIEPLRRAVMIGIPVVLGIFAGLSTSGRWSMVLEYFNRTPFGKTDPQFGLDIGFYVFELPFWRSIVAYSSAVVLIAGLAALAACYLYGALRFGGREVRISRAARIQLAVTAALYIALQAVSLWLDQYAALTKSNSLITGAQYTEVNAVIPGREIMAGIAAIVAILFIVTAVIGRWRISIVGTGLLLVAAIVIGGIYPWIVQRLQVKPSERTYESAYIERNIKATRDAYGVSDVKEQNYDATTEASSGALAQDAQTTANIRLIDPKIVSDTFSQLQQYRQYYQFPDELDVDRYDVKGETEDTVIAVRDIDLDGLSSAANTQYNRAFVYTHGYGVTAAFGNQRASDGKPVFLESGIPSNGALGDFQQRVYFGETSPAYSIVGAPKGSKDVELDYPSGSDDDNGGNATTTYSGDGGPSVGNFFNRLVYAAKFQSEQVLLSDAVNKDSQILYDRDPITRVQKVAPYLTVDSDAYPAIVDHRIQWVVDGYTTSDAYPYSQSQSLSDSIAGSESSAYRTDQVNYIRNSVKATVDAYTGKVTLYAWDTKDPVLKTWEKIFPTSVKSVSSMSAELLDHVRYPTDLFKVQRSILGTYHVTNANSFYSGDDAWNTPQEPTTTGSTDTDASAADTSTTTNALGAQTTTTASKANLQDPYYLTMKVPGQETAYNLYTTYIPQQSAGANNRNVLTGYLAADSDAGGAGKGKKASGYGKLTLLTMPKTDNIPGPAQVQNLFNSDTTVSQELNILKRGNSTVKQGNLLTLPVGGGFLYVQPVYVQSTSSGSYPLLQKVLVAFGDKIAFEDTLDEALNSLFGGDSGAAAGDSDASGSGSDSGSSGSGSSDSGSDSGSGSTGGSTGSGTTDNDALQQALSDANDALQDRQQAYADNDLVAAAEADKRLQEAIEAATAAEDGS